MSSSAAAGATGAAKRTYDAAIARIFSMSGKRTSAGSHSARTLFRPQPPKLTAANHISTTSGQLPSSISGLRFCLHMVAFAAPGVVLSKKLCDGESLEDMVHSAQDVVSRVQQQLV
ncbi:hypothetical protein BGZ98_005074 [Dissophora globulifera]|nr:hypothetical protein BGZ98_005074 [Dissophora globulifera]